MLIKNNVRFQGYQAQQMKLHVLGGDPSLTGTDGGRVWWDSSTGRFRGWDGSAMITLTNLVESVSGDGTIGASLANKIVSLSIPAATGSARGTMSSADKTKLDASTNASTPNTLALRDGNGDFAAANITAHLVGTADNATALGGQTLAQVRDFAQTTGQRGSRSALNDIDTVIQGTRLDQMTPPTANVSFNSQRLVSLADPVNPTDGANKQYVDSVASGLDVKASVRFATTSGLTATYANGTAGVGATLTATSNGAWPVTDGVTAVLNDRLLLKNQGTQNRNGIYRISDLGSGSTPWILTRATDADQAAEVTPGMFVFVEEGTTLGRTGWVLSSTGATTIGTTSLPFTQFSGAGTYLNGNGLSLTGTTFAVVGTTNRIAVGAGGVDIDAAYVGQTSITTLGTIATGTWQGTAVAVLYGGTGATTPAAARTNLGATTKQSADIPAGTSYTFNHGLGTRDVITAVQDTATHEYVYVDVVATDANNVTVTFGETVSAAAYRVIVIG
jgi:hypothetical protein